MKAFGGLSEANGYIRIQIIFKDLIIYNDVNFLVLTAGESPKLLTIRFIVNNGLEIRIQL